MHERTIIFITRVKRHVRAYYNIMTRWCIIINNYNDTIGFNYNKNTRIMQSVKTNPMRFAAEK